jgi:multidrug efflux pump subunit AcrB
VRRLALQFAEVLATDARTRHVHFDWMEPARQIRVHVDQDEARRLGVSSRTLAAVLNASVTGSTVTQLRDDIYLVNAVARATDDQRISYAALSSLQGAWCRSGNSRRSRKSRSSRWSGGATACPR